MITVGVIKNGSTYLSRHLRKNDYWAEGEKAAIGEWIGEGAKMLGLSGQVTDKPFEALRLNRHPHTGERLTRRENPNRVAFFDLQFSAPKDVSVLSVVGGDDRIREAFAESVKVALGEAERFAAVRERRGEAAASESFRLTGNFVGALFLHDTSRDLDPQLHAHAVLANATWDATRQEWLALQPAEMLRASTYLRQVLYRELAGRLRSSGYEPYAMCPTGFAVRGVEHLRERYSKRARQVQRLADEFAERKGRRPTKREVEVLVRESRAKKLTEISTPAVRAKQREELNSDEARSLDELVNRARIQGPRQQWSQGEPQEVLAAALRHSFERRSVVREGEVLTAALELYPDFYRWRELREALEKNSDVIRREGELTLRAIHREEWSAVDRVRANRNCYLRLGDASHLPEKLTVGQRRAAVQLLSSHDFLSVLIGDAGTGKTTVLAAIQAAHQADGGKPFMALAPTTRARDAVAASGFDGADTVQRFLVSEAMVTQAAGRVILVDEAGLLSTSQLALLTAKAHAVRARLLLVGDTKQHYSVERGDALRNIVTHSGTPVVRLTEVLRQRSEADRRFSRLLAAGRATDAFEFAERRGLIHEAPDDEQMFARAAEHYVRNRQQGIETLVVIPFWEEIERFNGHVRPALKRAGLLGEAEVKREAVKLLNWTEEQKGHWRQYQVGDRLLFARDSRWFKRGTAAEVTAILPDGLQVLDVRGRETKVTRRHRVVFEVGRVQVLPIAVGDKLLIRGRSDEAGLANGDFKEVARVDPLTGEVSLSDGKLLPKDFAAWTYGHALTTYRAQGSTAEESLLVLGEVAARSLVRRQFYVGNTRYRGAHAIYASNKDDLFRRLEQLDAGRELATEFLQRHQIVEVQQQSLRARLNAIWFEARRRVRRAIHRGERV